MMVRNVTILFVCVAILFCIGCGDGQANLGVANGRPTKLAADHDCAEIPDCFFDRYPENWEHVLYQRQLTARYEAREVPKK